jgi:hypothetical protein
MAGDWIKIELTLSDKPEVIRMATELRLDPDAVVGKLVRLWIWADQHSVTGSDMTITEAWLNKKVDCRNFAKAMRVAGWLTGEDGALTFPNFERHNGKTAKTRAMENRKKAAQRAREEHPDPVPESVPLPSGQTGGQPRDKTGGPEKRREENIPSPLSLSSAQAREGEESAEGDTGSGRPQSWPTDEAAARRIATEHDIDPNLAATLWHSHETRQQWPPGPFLSALKAKAGYVQQDLLGKQAIASTRHSAPQPNPTPKPADALHAKRSERYGY